MTLEKKISLLFGLNDEAWLQHANPWSFWTRFISLPFIVLAFWSRDWIGGYSLIPILLLFFWLYINPRFFVKPKTTKAWSSRSVIGEKIWANRDVIAVPIHHKPVIYSLSLIQILGTLLLAFGLYQLEFWPCFTGVVIIYLSKMWFLDRMVWVCEEMKEKKEYQDLLY